MSESFDDVLEDSHLNIIAAVENFANDQQIKSEGCFENFADNSNEEKDITNLNLVSENEVDDESIDDSKKLFVGGLSWETTENNLKDYFSKFGPVKACTIKVDKYTGHSRGFGFVVFEDEIYVEKVLEQKDHRLCNKKIDPKRAKPSAPPREPQKKIFVGGLCPEVSEDQIKEYFGSFGKIESLDLPIDNQRNKRKSFIFVTYVTETEALKAIENEQQEIFGKMCDVRIAVPREQTPRYQQSYMRSGWNQWGGYSGSWSGNNGAGYPPYQYGFGYDNSYSHQGYGSYDYGYGYSGYDYGYQDGYYNNYGASSTVNVSENMAENGSNGNNALSGTGACITPSDTTSSAGGKMRSGRGAGSASGSSVLASHPYRQ